MAPGEEPTFIESSTGWPETLPATQYSTPPKTRAPLNYDELIDNFIDGAQGASVEKATEMIAKLQAAANLPDLSKVGKGRGNKDKVKAKHEQLLDKLKESAQGLGSAGAQPNTNQS